jgi:hypothetical protein
MFEEQSIRLLREKWRTVQELAEELFAIFQTRGDIGHDGSLTLRPTDANPPLRIVQPFSPTSSTADNPGITITRGGTTTTITAGDVIINGQSLVGGDFGGGSGGGTNLNQIVGLVNTPEFAPFILLGEVVSGSGSNYQVRVFSTPDTNLGTVSAIQVQIDPAETIPAGTFCQVIGLPFRSGDLIFAQYYLTVPVWL